MTDQGVDDLMQNDLAAIPNNNLTRANQAAAGMINNAVAAITAASGIALTKRQALAVMSSQTDAVYIGQIAATSRIRVLP